MQDSRYEIRLSGSGGQGLILAGIILGEAASIYEGKEAVQTQSYGPESRGGTSKSEVVVSSAEIDFPKVTSPDLLLAMTQEACDKYIGDLSQDGVALLDTVFVERVPEGPHVVALPLTTMAREITGKTIAANIVALGAITAISGVVSKKAAEKAVLARVPKGTEEMNLRAFRAGYSAVHKPRQKRAA